MTGQLDAQSIIFNIDLGDVRKSMQAREELKQRTAEGAETSGEIKQRSEAAPDFEQSYTGKGSRLNLMA